MASIARIKGSDGSSNASLATIQSTRSPLASTIDVDTVAGIPANFMGSMGTPHTFIDPVTSEEITVISEATCVDFAGHVNGSDLEIDTIAPGYTDLGSDVGDVVIIRPTTQYADNIAAVLAVILNDDGTLKTGIVAALTIGAGAITAPKLSTGAILLGYVEKTTDFSTSSTTPVQVSGLTANVTIPTGGRKVKISAYFPAITNSGISTMTVEIWDGPVGLGTQVGQMNVNTADGSDNIGANCICIVSPSAGAKTYNVGVLTASGTAVFTGRSYGPSYLLVENV